jgi:hypothetical protein
MLATQRDRARHAIPSRLTRPLCALSRRGAPPEHPILATLLCAAGRLDCIKEESVSGLAYFVDPDSVERAITQLAQLHGITDEVRHATTVHDMSHHVAPCRLQTRMPDDTPRPSAANRDNDALEIQERQSPPQPVRALRDKETNLLIRGLQTMMAPLLGSGKRTDPPSTGRINCLRIEGKIARLSTGLGMESSVYDL